MTNDEAIIAPSHSQLLLPRPAQIGESIWFGLNQMLHWDMFAGVPLIGSKRSSMARSAAFLNAQTRRTRGT
ncbi:unnamed protein product [Dovyalis caffra]|uniref:Uncharacterized protein n=1 Tax=Dovyalis caffra TaxID=77055 RepID=A0AAV1RR44_9ROSI|nr:unnamed protein product [Dovyalis caffra]